MNQEIITNAFILLLSSAAELKGKEVKWKDEFGKDVFIEFPDLTPTHAIVRYYWDNGNKSWECAYVNGLLHGKSLAWYNNGNKWYEYEYANGLFHGKSLAWWDGGGKYLEREYKNGIIIE